MTEKKDKTEKVEKTLSITYKVKPVNRVRMALEFLLAFLVAIVLVYVIFFLAYFTVRAFPDYVPISNANDLLDILIRVDGILLGFVGIVFAQLMSSIWDQQNIIFKSLLDEPKNPSDRIEASKYLEVRRYILSAVAVGTFGSLLASIFVAMTNIAKNSKLLPTDTYAPFGFLFSPLVYTIIAVVLLALSMTILPIRTPLEEETEKA